MVELTKWNDIVILIISYHTISSNFLCTLFCKKLLIKVLKLKSGKWYKINMSIILLNNIEQQIQINLNVREVAVR